MREGLGVGDRSGALEAVLLTGGGSTRMGVDKAEIEIEGQPLGLRIATALKTVAGRVTILGRAPISGFEFVADVEEFGGPLSALARFNPEADLVCVASCDMPYFDPRIVGALVEALTEAAQAAVCVRAGIRQPTCALYRRSAFAEIPAVYGEGKRSLMAWLDRLSVVQVDEVALRKAGLDPLAYASFNTPMELERLVAEAKKLNEAPEPPPAPGG